MLLSAFSSQVTRVGEGGGMSNGSVIQTVAGNSSATTTSAANGTVPRSRPSDFGSELVQLDASQLHDSEGNVSSLQEELANASREEADETTVVTSTKKKKVETPSNELSLEAELSAAFASSNDADDAKNDLSLDEDIVAASTPKSESGKHFPPLSEKTEVKDDKSDDESAEPKEGGDNKEENKKDDTPDETSDDKMDDASLPLQQNSNGKSEPQEIKETSGPTIILEDESIAESPVPDIVATSLIKAESETPPDFMTSTPKKPDAPAADKSEIVTDSSQYQSLTENSTQYLSALSSQSQHSTYTDADDSGEFSFLGEKKFAALLQTVPSYEGEDSEMSMSFGSTSLDKSTDEMVSSSEKSGNITPTPVPSAQSEADQKLLVTDQNDSTTTIQANESQLQESPLMPVEEKKEESKKE